MIKTGRHAIISTFRQVAVGSRCPSSPHHHHHLQAPIVLECATCTHAALPCVLYLFSLSLSGPHLLLRLRLLLDCHHQEGAGSSFVPNDCYLSPAANFLLVTGPNGAGKVPPARPYIRPYLIPLSNPRHRPQRRRQDRLHQAGRLDRGAGADRLLRAGRARHGAHPRPPALSHRHQVQYACTHTLQG